MSSSDRPPSPTPSERERLDAEARKKEEAEQATLPYKWTQTIQDLDITIPLQGEIRAKNLIVEIKKTSMKVQVRGEEPKIDVSVRKLSDS